LFFISLFVSFSSLFIDFPPTYFYHFIVYFLFCKRKGIVLNWDLIFMLKNMYLMGGNCWVVAGIWYLDAHKKL